MYFDFDLAPEEVVWYFKIEEWVGQVMPTTWEIILPGSIILSTCMEIRAVCAVAPNIIVPEDCKCGCTAQHAVWFSNLRYLWVFLAHLALLLTWSCSTRPFPLGLPKKHNIQNISCKYLLLTVANSGVYSWILREMLQHVTTSSPLWLRCVLNVVVTYKVSHSNTYNELEFTEAFMYVSNSINKIFPFCLIMLFHFKDCKVFLMHSVYWCEIMVSEKVGPIILVSLDTSHTNLTACDGTSCSSMGFSTNIHYSEHSLIQWDLTKLYFSTGWSWGAYMPQYCKFSELSFASQSLFWSLWTTDVLCRHTCSSLIAFGIDDIDSPMYYASQATYRVIQNDCRGFNNLSYTIHLR